MSAREVILGRVRSALGRTGGAPVDVPEVRIRVPETDAETRLTQFTVALEKLAAKPYVASSTDDARRYVETVVDGRTALSTSADIVRACGISYAEAVDRAEVGITGVDFALADTGTLVVLSQSEPRLTSLLPPVHIALVRREQILATIDELFTLLPRPAEQTASMVLITGPSRTADIEQILVRGVHGPGELHVIIL